MAEAELKRNIKARSVTRRYVKKIIDKTDEVLKEDGDQEQANKLLTNKDILIAIQAKLKETAEIPGIIQASRLQTCMSTRRIRSCYKPRGYR